jgi:hypothetical protein
MRCLVDEQRPMKVRFRLSALHISPVAVRLCLIRKYVGYVINTSHPHSNMVVTISASYALSELISSMSARCYAGFASPRMRNL